VKRRGFFGAVAAAAAGAAAAKIPAVKAQKPLPEEKAAPEPPKKQCDNPDCRDGVVTVYTPSSNVAGIQDGGLLPTAGTESYTSYTCPDCNGPGMIAVKVHGSNSYITTYRDLGKATR
jgi:hypothetical protein